jgi:hypothetical protein
VRREREIVDAPGAHLDLAMGDELRGVDQGARPVAVRDAADLRQVIERPGDRDEPDALLPMLAPVVVGGGGSHGDPEGARPLARDYSGPFSSAIRGREKRVAVRDSNRESRGILVAQVDEEPLAGTLPWAASNRSTGVGPKMSRRAMGDSSIATAMCAFDEVGI